MATREKTAKRSGSTRPRQQRRATVRRPSLDVEWGRTERALRLFEQLESLAGKARERDQDAAAAVDAEGLAWQQLREADPIRISHAQRLLGVSNQTVRDWVSAGVLDSVGGAPERVGLDGVIRAKLIADELRARGQDRDFMSAVLSRLEALSLARDEDFRKSMRQMRGGKRLPRPY